MNERPDSLLTWKNLLLHLLAYFIGGCCAGALYWAIAIHRSTKPTRSPVA